MGEKLDNVLGFPCRICGDARYSCAVWDGKGDSKDIQPCVKLAPDQKDCPYRFTNFPIKFL